MYKRLSTLLIALLLTACAVGPKQLGLSRTHWDHLSADQQRQLKFDYKQIKVANSKMVLVAKGAPVQVKLSGGQAKFPPNQQHSRYQPTTFTIQPGTCREVGLRAASPNNALTVLKACYSDEVLFFDPSTYNQDKQQASIYIQYQPLWARGFTYKGISSEGFVGLKAVNIRVRTVKK